MNSPHLDLPRTRTALARLEAALGRLEAASIQAGKVEDGLVAELAQAREQYAALQELTETVSDRLDAAIDQLQTVLEEE
ncbi:hypothetical protein [Telmatospirillum sp. J64-1]|uniref:hypothetical protein n=1 Tax=Telmatospirillum sp. J64-1 TaxID=2502183 RepID=UPI00115DC4FF|nr:hypothetical protein [Telmatospirillum sp. J64-1]